MKYYIDARGSTKVYIDMLLPNLIEQLKLTTCRKLLYVKVDKDLEHPGETLPMLGIDTLFVCLRPCRNRVELGITLAHEMVHVAQIAKGLLKLTPKGKKWKGKFYSRSYPYLEQPWEVQAFQKQELIFRRAIQE
jgi:hypothetical protein